MIETNTKRLILGCKNSTIPDDNSVEIIGSNAFYGASITSITLPNSIKLIDDFAFNWCSNLQSVTMGDGLITIGRSAFTECKNLVSVTLGKNLKTVGASAFAWCEKLQSVTFGKELSTIASGAFGKCIALTQCIARAAIPAKILPSVFADITVDMTLTVPCGAAEAYKTAQYWPDVFATIAEGFVLNFTVLSADETQGTVEIMQAPTCQNDATAIFTEKARDGYEFMGWSDGNTENPRTVEVLDDVKYVANFGSMTGVENITAESASDT